MKKDTAGAVWKGTVKEGNGVLSTKSNVLNGKMYSYNSRFQNGEGTNPDELLAASHAGCFAMATSLMLGKSGFTPDSLDATAELSMNYEKLQIVSSHLTLKAKIPGITEEQFQEIANNAKENCPISKVLNCDITLDAKLEN
ncbi:MAG: OsmC family protein [Weeksellaceae bacterium]|nr:OsmC family protein [Weeksellaceae bacterium]MDX9704793.1 OsmC family protein [Weeksellaceae bacterium]